MKELHYFTSCCRKKLKAFEPFRSFKLWKDCLALIQLFPAAAPFFIGLTVGFMLVSCMKKDPKIEEDPVVLSSVQFNFQAKINEDLLVPETKMYTNFSQDSFTITKFNYYISNVKLIRTDGSGYAEPESYHLMRHVEGKTSFNINAVPEGNYTKIEFLIGVDSARNISGAQVGDLAPTAEMYWNWEQGYIFFKMEGVFNSPNRPERGDYAIHVGGFAGPYASLQKCVFDLNVPVSAKNGSQSTISYNVQIEELFVKPKVIGFDYYYDNIPLGEDIFRQISVNYKDMFVINKIQN